MKKVAIASLLSVSALFAAPGVISNFGTAMAQVGSGQVTLDPAEFADYDAATKQTTPQAQATAYEAFLTKYPKSAVKADVAQRLMFAYYQFDHAKAIDAADRVLVVNPSSLQAYTIEVAFRQEAAQAQTDPAAKQAGLDAAASYATKALAVTTPPAGTPPADFAAIQKQVTPTFYSAIGTAALNKKDMPTAISAFKSELAAAPIGDTQKPGTLLQDTYYLGTAYYGSTPPDYIDCTFYATRAASYAPDNFKAQLQPLATYCYKKYHGWTDGYDAVVAAAQANLNPPAGFSIVPAPTNEDIVKKTIAETPDLATLALADKEFIIQYGKPEDADKVFTTVKGKTTEIPDAVFISGTADKIMVAVSDDAIQSKTADFTYNMKTPLKTIPAAGAKITLTGTYSSYTQTPLMIVMDGGEEVSKAPVKKAPVRRR